MKVTALAVAFMMSAPAWAVAAPALGGGANMVTSPVTNSYAQQYRKRQAILAVREEGLRLRAADGGKLTDTHRAYLQAKLDAAKVGNY